MKPLFNPSLMCMDLLNIKEQIEILNERADMYHVDIMDGHFVKNITLSPDFVKAISKVVKIPMDCHLMVTDPDDYIESLAKAGAGYICPHAETINSDAFRIINKIRANGCKVGVVLNPATPLSVLDYVLEDLDMILLMTVNPGFGGQSYIDECTEKIEIVNAIVHEYNLKTLIEVDGGIKVDNVCIPLDAGANVIVAGSAVFGGNVEENVKNFKEQFQNFED